MAQFGAMAEMFCTINCMTDLLGGAQYAPDRTVAMDAVFAAGGAADKHLAAMEKLSSPKGTITPADCAAAGLLCMLTQLDGAFIGDLSKYPKLKAASNAVNANKKVTAYVATVPHPYFSRKSD
jgi:hypothetical protein